MNAQKAYEAVSKGTVENWNDTIRKVIQALTGEEEKPERMKFEHRKYYRYKMLGAFQGNIYACVFWDYHQGVERYSLISLIDCGSWTGPMSLEKLTDKCRVEFTPVKVRIVEEE